MSWPAHDVTPEKNISTFLRASLLLSELKAFSASITGMASVSDFSNSFLKLWITHSILHFKIGIFFRDFQCLILYIG